MKLPYNLIMTDYVNTEKYFRIDVGLWPDGSRYETRIGLWPLAVKFWYRIHVRLK